MAKSPQDRFTINWDAVVVSGFLLYVVLFFAGVAFVLRDLHARFDCTSTAAVVASEDVGRLRTVHFIDQFIRHETIIDTEKGSFLVCGTFPVIKNHALTLERREDGARMLCDPAEKTCARLAR